MNEAKAAIVVAVDGPAGAGKSTVAKKLAEKLNFSYLDTGAMYRALTLKALREKLDLADEEQLVQLAQRTSINLKYDSIKSVIILLDDEDVSEEIRSLEVTNNTFYIARAPKVRGIMVQWQREIGEKENVVAEGRDIGTVVFPNAKIKFYLDANFEERSLRRIRELEEKGKTIDAEKLKIELRDRDNKDMSRSVGPLKKADDAVFVDSTHLSIDGVVDAMVKHIEAV